jgi:hypothetical protein
MADVKINIIGEDRATASLKKVDTTLDKLSTGFEKLTGVNLKNAISFGAVVAVVGKVTDEFKKALTSTINYAEQVRDLGRKLGITTEEASRLIQVADDLKVEYGTLTAAFRIALNQGITPNIDGLIKLSEEYQTIPTATGRAQFAMQAFGRQGLEMQKILEQTPATIRAMVDELEGSALIMSGESVQAARDYEIAVDNLNDSWLAFQVTIGTKVIPILVDALGGINAFSDGLSGLNNVLARNNSYEQILLDSRNAGIITMEEYLDITNRVYDRTMTQADALTIVANRTHYLIGSEQLLMDARTSAYGAQRAGMAAVSDETERSTRVLDENEQYWKSWGFSAIHETMELTDQQALLYEQIDANNRAMSDLDTVVNGQFGPSMEDFTSGQADLAAEMETVQGRIDELNGKSYLTPAQRTELAELEIEYGNLSTQYAENATAHEEATRRILFGLLTQRAAIDGLTAAELTVLTSIATSWGLVDDSTAGAMQGFDDALALVQGDSPNVVGAMAGVRSVGEEFGLIPPAATTAIEETVNGPLAALQIELGIISGAVTGIAGDYAINYTVTVSGDPIPATGGGGVSGGGSRSAPAPPTGLQHGGIFTVPPGYNNDNYPIYGSSGETFAASGAGAHRPLTQNFTFNFPGMNSPDSRAVKFAAREGVLAAMRSVGVR